MTDHATQRHHPRRRLRHPPAPGDARAQQAAAAGVRQADGLLPAEHADAGRHPRHPADQHAAGHAALRGAARRRLASGACDLSYCVQPSPDGLAQAFILGREFVGGAAERAGARRQHLLRPRLAARCCDGADARDRGATVFAYHVHDPERYGVVEFDAAAARPQHRGKAEARRRATTRSPASTSTTTRSATSPPPSSRQRARRARDHRRQRTLPASSGQLDVEIMGRGYAWLDTGTHDSLLEAGQFIATLEKRQGLKVACPEEIAFRAGWISRRRSSRRWPQPMLKNGYGQYLLQIAERAGVLMKVTPTAHRRRADRRAEGVRRRARLLHRELQPAGLRRRGRPRRSSFVQDNHSRSARGVLRGLHYQLPPHAQGKLVRVTQRRGLRRRGRHPRAAAPTFGQWVGVELDDDNQRQLWIPPGFAHGFLVAERERRLPLQDHRLLRARSARSASAGTIRRWRSPGPTSACRSRSRPRTGPRPPSTQPCRAASKCQQVPLRCGASAPASDSGYTAAFSH